MSYVFAVLLTFFGFIYGAQAEETTGPHPVTAQEEKDYLEFGNWHLTDEEKVYIAIAASIIVIGAEMLHHKKKK